MSQDLYALRETVKWRSRRGLLELDLFFTRFLREHLDGLDASALEALLDLLTCDDHSLWAMVSGKEACEVPEWQDTVALLRRCAPDVPPM